MKLKSSTNTLEVRDEIEQLAENLYLEDVLSDSYDCFFEHGQWFIYDLEYDIMYSVVDAEPGFYEGLDIEML